MRLFHCSGLCWVEDLTTGHRDSVRKSRQAPGTLWKRETGELVSASHKGWSDWAAAALNVTIIFPAANPEVLTLESSYLES